MANDLCTYVVTAPEVFAEIATVSGLTKHDTLIRFSLEIIIGKLKDSTGCMTSAAITAFVEKYSSLSGDCYAAMLVDCNGNDVLVLDVVRPDDPYNNGMYVMDQEPIYIFKSFDGWDSIEESTKAFHLNCEGRTFELSSYYELSAYTEEKRDTPFPCAQISAIDPGIMNTMKFGLSCIEKGMS